MWLLYFYTKENFADFVCILPEKIVVSGKVEGSSEGVRSKYL